MLLRYTDIPDFLPQIIRGVVCDKQSRLPLNNVGVYTIKGAEETVTNCNGEFTIATWQDLPLTVTLRIKGLPEIMEKIDCVSEKPTILLVQQ
jgi:hypothetical protein